MDEQIAILEKALSDPNLDPNVKVMIEGLIEYSLRNMNYLANQIDTLSGRIRYLEQQIGPTVLYCGS